jgi:hypothetical protein
MDVLASPTALSCTTACDHGMAAKAPSQYDIEKTNIKRGFPQDIGRPFYFGKQLRTVPARPGLSEQKLVWKLQA